MSEIRKTKEHQFNRLFDVAEKYGVASLGLLINQAWNEDPRRALFTLARYKFVSKILDGKKNVLEVGCGDAFGTRLVQQTVSNVTVADFDPVFIEDVKSRLNAYWPMNYLIHDVLSCPVPGVFDAVFGLDVLEHIDPTKEDQFIKNALKSLHENGVLIMGMPSLESQTYASQMAKEGHVNCKSGKDLKLFFEKYFYNVFVFSMNDEVVHTGFYPMANYLIAVCCNKRHL